MIATSKSYPSAIWSDDGDDLSDEDGREMGWKPWTIAVVATKIDRVTFMATEQQEL
jgi:hypothetical protein